MSRGARAGEWAAGVRLGRVLARATCALALSSSLACVALVREAPPELIRAPSGSALRDVAVEVSATSDERIFENFSTAQERAWTGEVLRGMRDSGHFRRIRDRAGADEAWRAEVSLERRRIDSEVLDTLFLLSGFLVPGRTRTDLTLTLVLTPPESEGLPAVVVRSGFNEYHSWLMLPFGLFSSSSDDAETEIVYELTRAALQDALRAS